jgi:cellulose synthase operon protein C
MPIPVETLRLVQSLYDRGLHLQAYQAAISDAPLTAWTEPEAGILAGRIALQIGAQRFGWNAHLRAWRQDRTSAKAAHYYARTLLSRGGLFKAWEFVRSYEDWPVATPRERSDWWSLRAQLLSEFRDFDAAIECIERAIAIDPQNYWLYVNQAWIWEEQDLYVEALAAATKALEFKPNDSAAIMTIARMLTLLERDDEALDLLQQAMLQSESSAMAYTLAQLQIELGDYVGAQQSYQRYAELTPLLEAIGQQWLLSRQADLAYYLGDFDTASQLAGQVQSPFYQRIAERLQAKPLLGKRVLLPVGFVRQHRATCAPATLATLTRFWAKPIDHLTIAAEICYDGTAPYRERRWAAQNGWIAREFTITWESAVALIDRGIPLTLTTTELTSGHLQAIIGYDSYLQQFLVRDPYHRQIGEMWAQELISHYAAFGPRGMVLIPADRPELLANIDLADVDLYDKSYELHDAIERHQREIASQIHQQMVALDANHRLTLDAERLIAGYDGDETRVLAAIEKSLLQFPDCGNLVLHKLSCLRELARREERLELLVDMCSRNSHPVFWQYYAQEIGEDGRSTDLAISVLKRTIRRMPSSAQNYYSLARILWLQRDYVVAFELYRFATCLEDKKSTYAKTYFLTARHRKQTKQALQLLEQRAQRFGAKSAEPILTLFWAYSQLNRMPAAFALLERSIADEPGVDRSQQDDLLIAAANAYAEYGQYSSVERILAKTRYTVAPTIWRRTAAELAAKQGDMAASLVHWQSILEIEPLAIDVNRSIANLLAETQGVATALHFLKDACNRFPHSYSLHQLWSVWLLEADDLVENERVLRHLTEIDPSDAWTRRQLARVLGKQCNFAAAFGEIELARQLDPHNSSERLIYGYLQELSGDNVAAKVAYKEAIQLSIDSSGSIEYLLSICYSQEERLTALAFVFDELTQQVTLGDALTTYQEQAAHILSPEVLLAQMQEAWAQRPDLWQAWSVLTLQLLQLERLDEALEIAQNYTEQFPLLPNAWLDLSTIYRQRQDNDHEIIALHRALAIEPTWSVAIGRLCRLYERTAQFELCQALLENAILREPREMSHHCHLAELFWRIEQRDAALDRLKIVVQHTSGGHNYAWVWEKLREWSIACEQPELAPTLVRELTDHRPGDARSWYFLAATLFDDADRPERLAALDRALELDAYYTDAYDLKARLLTHMEEYEVALAVCNTTAWSSERPTSLRARAVWVEQQWGKHQNAMTHLLEIIAIEPSYEWAWLQLTEYYDRLDNLAEYLPAAQKLVELDPRDPINWGYLGDAYHRTGSRSEAQMAWEKSIEISPSYDYGGVALFESYWQTPDFYAAAQTFTKIQPHLEPVAYLPLQIKLAVHHQDYLGAAVALAELCHCDLENSDGLRTAITAMQSAGLAENIESVLSEQLSIEGVSPVVPLFWLESIGKLNLWLKADRYLRNLDFATESGQEVVRIYLGLLGQHQQSKILLGFIRHHRAALRQTTLLWGSVGHALRLLQANRAVIKWSADWSKRPDVEPWMLGNLSEAWRAIGSDEKALAINQFALNLPTENGQYYHLAWLAFDLARLGNIDAAGDYIRMLLPNNDYQPEYQFLIEITQAVIAAQATMGSSVVRLKIVNKHLTAAKQIYPQFTHDSPFYRAYRQALAILYTLSLPLMSEWCRGIWIWLRQLLSLKQIFN